METTGKSGTWIGHSVIVGIADADEVEKRENGNSPITGLHLFPLIPTWRTWLPSRHGLVRTGTGRENTLHTMGGIPGGVSGESAKVYVSVGMGADTYQCSDTGNATACVEVGGE
jgi:hypothetical protein